MLFADSSVPLSAYSLQKLLISSIKTLFVLEMFRSTQQLTKRLVELGLVHLFVTKYVCMYDYIIMRTKKQLGWLNPQHLPIPSPVTAKQRVVKIPDQSEEGIDALNCEPKRKHTKIFCHTFYKTRSILIEFSYWPPAEPLPGAHGTLRYRGTPVKTLLYGVNHVNKLP